jgi:hypothetical protein
METPTPEEVTGVLNPRRYSTPDPAPTIESSGRQRARLEAHFRLHGSISTLEGRNVLGILHPAARVQELRESGHRIITVWNRETDATGRRHRVARYHWSGVAEPQQ